jgi:hypothetical protein
LLPFIFFSCIQQSPLALFVIKKEKEIKEVVVNNIHFSGLLGYKSNVKFK